MKYAFFESLSSTEKYYFNFQTDEGQVLLISHGYKEQADCELGVQEVIEKVSDAHRYQRTEVKADEYFFSLIGDDNERPLGMSVAFETQTEMERAIKLLMAVNGTNISWVDEVEEEEVEEEEMVEEIVYRIEEEDQGPQYSIFLRGKYKEADIEGLKYNKKNLYYYQFLREGKPILKSYIYRRKVGCERDLQIAINNAPDQNKYKLKKVSDTKYYFNLISPEGVIVGVSKMFEHTEAMKEGISWLLGEPYQGRIEDHLPVSALDIELLPLVYDGKQKRIIEPFRSIPFNKVFIESWFKNDTAKYYFNFEDREGIPIIVSQAYDSKETCTEAIKSIMRASKHLANFEVKDNEKEEYFFNIKNQDGKLLFTSVLYDDKAQVDKAVNWMTGRSVRKRIRPSKEQMARAKAELAAKEAERLAQERARLEAERRRLEMIRKEREAQRLREEEEERKAAEERRAYREQKRKEEEELRRQNRLRLEEEERQQLALKKQQEEEARLEEERHKQKELERKRAEKKRKQEEAERIKQAKLEKERKRRETPKPAKKEVKKEVVQAIKEEPILETAPIIETTTIKEESSGLKKYLPFVLIALLAPLLWLGIRGCGGENNSHNVSNSTSVAKTLVGPSAKQLGFTSNTTEAQIADFLSLAASKVPQSFVLKQLDFEENTPNIKEGNTQLDDLIKILGSYPNVKINITADLQAQEQAAYQEMGLAHARAKMVFDYLKARGIQENRMNFQATQPSKNNRQVTLIITDK